MKKLCAASLVSMLSIVSVGLFTPPLAVAGSRGQVPECQEECLIKHTEKMHEAARNYRKTGNRLDYQTNVQRLVYEYRVCLDNCQEPYPVK